MAITYALLRNITARDMISALIRDGFTIDRGVGSHQIFYHSDGRRVTVMFRGAGRAVTRAALKSMIGQACWTEEDLGRLKLIR